MMKCNRCLCRDLRKWIKEINQPKNRSILSFISINETRPPINLSDEHLRRRWTHQMKLNLWLSAHTPKRTTELIACREPIDVRASCKSDHRRFLYCLRRPQFSNEKLICFACESWWALSVCCGNIHRQRWFAHAHELLLHYWTIECEFCPSQFTHFNRL